MNIRIPFFLFALVACPFAGADGSTPSYFAARPGVLAEVKARLTRGDPCLQPALTNLLTEAGEALKIAPPTVVQKANTPPSGDKHDYMSLAPYYWPDPATTNGLPYIRHDGKVNPESRDDSFDRGRLSSMARTVETLAFAYYFTGKESYAEHAARCLRVWFLDPATRMNPHLNFAQAVPGRNTGRGAGIIEGRRLSAAADAAGLLAGSASWSPPDGAALEAWLSTYLDWLLTSNNGREEAAALNNHGTFYDLQVVEVCLLLGRRELAKEVCQAAGQKRLSVQIRPDGRQPLELERTASLGYSRLNLEALFGLATLGEHAGVDLWHYPLPDGQAALPAALDFLLPYVTDPSQKWPYEQIKAVSLADFAPLLRQAAVVYGRPKYEEPLSAVPDVSSRRFQLLAPKQTPHLLDLPAR